MIFKTIMLAIFVMAIALSPMATGLEEAMTKNFLIHDTSGDGVPDQIRTQIIVPCRPSPEQICGASEIMARLCTESAGIDFDIITTADKFVPKKDYSLIIIGRLNPFLSPALVDEIPPSIKQKKSWAAIVNGHNNGHRAIFIFGSSSRSELYAIRSFFDRWPYAWDIWGRKNGITYNKILADILKFTNERGIKPPYLAVHAIYYVPKQFENISKEQSDNIAHEMEGYVWDTGEIARLVVDFPCGVKQWQKIERVVKTIINSRTRGEYTTVLNYPGIAKIQLINSHFPSRQEVLIPRFSLPVRFLNRRFLPPLPKKTDGEIYLDNLYSISGLYRDMNKDKIADDIPFTIALDDKDVPIQSAYLAGRLTLETTGVRLPMLKFASELPSIGNSGPLIIVGQNSGMYKQLEKLGFNFNIQKDFPGALLAINYPPAGGPHLLIAGKNSTSISKTEQYVARYYPYLNKRRDETETVQELLYQTKQLLTMNSPLSALADLISQKGKKINTVSASHASVLNCKIYLKRINKEVSESFLKNLNKIFPMCNWHITPCETPRTEFNISKTLPWEGDIVKKAIIEWLSKNNSQNGLSLDIRLSEPEEFRKKLGKELKKEIDKIFPSAISSLRVLSAYKQGYSWIAESVLPELKGKKISKIKIYFQKYSPGLKHWFKVYREPFRWLQELYPIDMIISKQLDIPIDNIVFVETKEDSRLPIYRIETYSKKGIILYKDSFSPLYQERFFFKKYPSWGKAPVWLSGFVLSKNGKLLVKKSFETDMSMVWNVYQDEFLPKLDKFIMKQTDNNPTPDKQPFFQRLVMDLYGSEPDEKIPFQQEHISSLESMHEDFYFGTLEYINQLLIKERCPGGESVHYVRANPYGAPGTVYPIVHRSKLGKGASVTFRLEVPSSYHQTLLLEYKTLEGVHHKEKATPMKFHPKSIHCTTLYIDENMSAKGARIVIEFEKSSELEHFARWIGALQKLVDFHSMLPSALGALSAIEFEVKTSNSSGIFTLKIKSHPVKKVLTGKSKKIPHITTDHIVSPEECVNVMKSFINVPGYHVFQAGTSYEGRQIWAAEITSPSKSEIISKVKMSLFKPTIMLTGRQHANEVASTSYLLKLMELLLTDNVWQKYLQKINFVIHPMENPDGAATAYALQKITPEHCLHAGRFSALGIDVGYQVNNPNTILTEALVRNFLYNRWLPDIYLNLHGYPSHEWVEQFFGYTPYLFRQYWIPRGWFAYFTYDNSGLNPRYSEAGEKLLKYIAKSIESDSEIASFDRIFYNLYRRWGIRWQPHIHYMDIVEKTNIYHKRRTETARRPSERTKITFSQGVTEVMDETAHDGFLQFLSKQGLYYIKAHLDYLFDSKIRIIHVDEIHRGRVRLQRFRLRPLMVKEEK